MHGLGYSISAAPRVDYSGITQLGAPRYRSVDSFQVFVEETGDSIWLGARLSEALTWDEITGKNALL